MIVLSRFKVKNFKQFNELCLDFSDVRDYSFNKKCLTKNGRLLKTILVYGPNASGKSNLGLAIFDIVQHLVDKFTSQRAYQYYLNADHPEKAAEFEYVFKFSRYTITYGHL